MANTDFGAEDMDQEHLEEWASLRNTAIQRLREGAARPAGRRACCVEVRYLILPSFDPSQSYEVWCRSTRSAPPEFIAAETTWRSDLDMAKFQSPVERLRHPRHLEPTIAHRTGTIYRAGIESVIANLKSLKVAVEPGAAHFGLDGVTYELQVWESSFTRSSFTWWFGPPEPWKELAAVGEQVRAEVTRALAEASHQG